MNIKEFLGDIEFAIVGALPPFIVRHLPTPYWLNRTLAWGEDREGQPYNYMAEKCLPSLEKQLKGVRWLEEHAEEGANMATELLPYVWGDDLPLALALQGKFYLPEKQKTPEVLRKIVETHDVNLLKQYMEKINPDANFLREFMRKNKQIGIIAAKLVPEAFQSVMDIPMFESVIADGNPRSTAEFLMLKGEDMSFAKHLVNSKKYRYEALSVAYNFPEVLANLGIEDLPKDCRYDFLRQVLYPGVFQPDENAYKWACQVLELDPDSSMHACVVHQMAEQIFSRDTVKGA